MTGRPRSTSSTGRRASSCCSRVGQSVAARNGSSVRSSPTPTAPASSARRASVLEATLASRVMSTPSVVRAGKARDTASSAADGVPVRVRSRATVAASGSTRKAPLSPSTATVTPAGASSAAGSTPTTSGTPSERATIDACEPAPPSTDTAPVTCSAYSSRSGAVTSCASRTNGPAGGAGGTRPPSRSLTIRPTWRMSAARSRRSADARPAITAAWRSATRVTAEVASVPGSSSRTTTSSAKEGSRAMSASASRMSAYWTAPSARNDAARSSRRDAVASKALRTVSGVAGGTGTRWSGTAPRGRHPGARAAPGEQGTAGYVVVMTRARPGSPPARAAATPSRWHRGPGARRCGPRGSWPGP